MARPPDPSRVIEAPGPWRHRYVAANGARFHLVESPPQGSGDDAPLVLLLHGFPEFWWCWRAQLPALGAAGYRAAAMDLRGYGGSDKTPRGYDPLTLAQDVSGVVKALGERAAVVVGHGWGGYVGWAAAVLRPREVTALAAVSAPHPRVMLRNLWPSGSRALLGHLLAMQVPMLPERRVSRPDAHYLRAHLEAWTGPGSRFPDEAAVETYQAALRMWPAPHCALEYHRWLIRSRARADGRAFARAMARPVQQPVCLIYGEADPALDAAAEDASARYVRGDLRRHRMPGVGHFPPEEHPEALTGILLDWLADVHRPRV